MPKTLELMFANGSRIQIEGSEAEGAENERGLVDVVQRIAEPFDATLDILRSIADDLQASVSRAVHPPDSVTVTFGLNFKAETGVILTKGSVGANLEVTMVWKKA